MLIFALNRHLVCYNSLNYGQQYGGGDNQVQNRVRFCVQTDSRAGFNVSSIHGFLTIFCLSGSHLNRLLKRGPESGKTDYSDLPYLQSKLMSSGYHGRFCGHTSGKNISSRLVMGASNWRDFTLICKAVITKMIRQDATRAAQYKENLRRPRRILLWSIVELLYCRQSQWLLIKRDEKDQYNQTLVLYVYTVCLNCYAR